MTEQEEQRFPKRYPNVTLCEVLTWRAFGQFESKEELASRIKELGTLPSELCVKLDKAKAELVLEINNNIFSPASGYLHESGSDAALRTDISLSFFGDTVDMEPLSDTISPNLDDPIRMERLGLNAVYPYYTDVRIDVRRLMFEREDSLLRPLMEKTARSSATSSIKLGADENGPQYSAGSAKKKRGYDEADGPLIEKMRVMTEGGKKKPWTAAMSLVSDAAGSGTDEAKAKRLVGKFWKRFPA